MSTRGEKRLVRRLMAVKSIRYTEALQELRELSPEISWRAYIDKCEQQRAKTTTVRA